MSTKQISIPSKHIPLSIPFLHGKEWKYIKECLDTGWVSSAGKYVEIFERQISRYNRVPYTVACTSGTAALQMALLSIGIKPDDEVIVPTVTFIATVNAVSYHRAHPVFMDCDDFYNIDVLKTIEFIQKETGFKNGVSYNKKTKKRISAIIPVHVFGNAVDLSRLVPICKERHIKVIEDATESLGTFYTSGAFKNRFTGTIGDIGCFSFNGNKIITTGGGGMIATHQAVYARQARYYTTQAKDNRTYYIHNAIGYNFRLNNMQAALGVAQLENLPHVIKIKSRNYRQYKEGINDIEGLTVADVPGYARNNLWMYALQIDTKKYGRTRDELLKIFSKKDVELRPLWHLNHLQKPYRKYQAYRIQKAPQMLAKTLNLPCSVGLRKEEISRVIMLLKKWKRKT